MPSLPEARRDSNRLVTEFRGLPQRPGVTGRYGCCIINSEVKVTVDQYSNVSREYAGNLRGYPAPARYRETWTLLTFGFAKNNYVPNTPEHVEF